MRAVEELAKATAGLEPDPVHDLRVAVRRCRSMAEGLRTIDPGPGWKRFRRLPKPLFSALGALRDTHVLQEWLAKLTPPDDVARLAIGSALAARALGQEQAVRAAMQEFNPKRWLKLAAELDRRVRRIALGGRVFQHLAVERWQEGFRLHESAMRTQRPQELHQLRICIKRFRYTVENFLPEHHRRWSRDLKHMQDLLGEVHDLDVFLEEVRRRPELGGAGERLCTRIHAERAQRVQEYESRTSGPESLWTQWRAGLPSGRQLSLAVTAKLRQWARASDPEPPHSRRLAQLSGRLWRELRRELGWADDSRTVALLRAAALLHNVAGGKRKPKRTSARSKMMGKLTAPVGWSGEEMQVMRLVSAYGVAGYPSDDDEQFRALSATRQQQVLRLAGILRLAHGLDANMQPGAKLAVRRAENVLLLSVEGFDPRSAQVAEVAAARHLLEVAEDLPILIRPMPPTWKEIVLRKAAHA